MASTYGYNFSQWNRKVEPEGYHRELGDTFERAVYGRVLHMRDDEWK